jgi:hypothetical protein
VSESIHKENVSSSDIRLSFMNNNGDGVPENMANIRQEFEKSGVPNQLKGILRIHLEFPSVQGGTPRSRVETERDSNGVIVKEDVMAYIDCDNMDEFFVEGIGNFDQDIRNLKNIIWYVAKNSKKLNQVPGCKCKKVNCNKGHCSCYRAGQACTGSCKCDACQNPNGSR